MAAGDTNVGSRPYKIEINSVPNCEECEDYAQELRELVGQIPGWKSGGSVLTFGGYPYRMGLKLFRNKKSSVQVTQKLAAAFASASIPMTEDPPEEYQEPDAIIVVARRSK